MTAPTPMRWFLMACPILRGGNLVVTEEGIRDERPPGAAAAVEHLLLLHAVRQRGRRRRGLRAAPDRRARCADARRRWTATCWRARGTSSTDVTDAARRLRRAGGCEAVREYLDVLTNWYVRTPRRPVLGRGRRRLRHPLDGARGAHPGHGAARAAAHRGGLARPDRRPQRAPGRLAGTRTSADRPRTARLPDDAPRRARWTRSGRSSRPTLGLRKASGAARAAAAAHARGRGRRPGRRSRRSPTCSRAELNVKAGRPASTSPRPAAPSLRHHAAPRGQRPRRRPAARPRRAGGHQGRQGRGLASRTATRVVVDAPTTATCCSSRPSTS